MMTLSSMSIVDLSHRVLLQPLLHGLELEEPAAAPSILNRLGFEPSDWPLKLDFAVHLYVFYNAVYCLAAWWP